MSHRLKVLIADDDATARISLSGMIPWSDYGYELLPPASDGEEALALCLKHRPDIVITDMKMPGMDGITFLRHLKESGQRPYILALSGYDDFFLLREAMHLGASDYILKMEINGRKLLEHLPDAQADPPDAAYGDQQERLLRDLIHHYFANSEEFSGKLRASGISFSDSRVWCFYLAIADLYRFEDASEEDYQRFRASLTNIIREITGDCLNGYQVFGQTGEIYFFGCLKKVYTGRDDLIAWTGNRLREMLKTYLDVSSQIGISVGGSSPEALCRTAGQAAEAVRLRYFSDGGHVVMWDSVRTRAPYESGKGYELCLELRQALRSLQEDAVQHVLSRADNELEEIPAEERLVMLMEFYGCARDQVKYFGQDPARYLSQSTRDTEGFMQMHSTGAMHAWLAVFQSEVCLWIRKSAQESGSAGIAREACRRIQEHFAEPLSLTTLSGELGVSSGYLSTLMKRQTGRNFSEYLLEVRVSQAKKLLLETDDAQTVIAERVGYSDPYYFNRQFKKMVGVSPGEWRKRYRSEGAAT